MLLLLLLLLWMVYCTSTIEISLLLLPRFFFSLLLLRPKHTWTFVIIVAKFSAFFFLLIRFFSFLLICHSHATNFRTLTHAYGELSSGVCVRIISFFGLSLMLRVCACVTAVLSFFFFFSKIKCKLHACHISFIFKPRMIRNTIQAQQSEEKSC